MDELGVSMRHNALEPGESYLFQKIGLFKDHYEGDETAFNWYAKGTPFLMDYGTYTGDAGLPSAHNAIEIPDQDAIRRGYLADHLFTPSLDYTRCEVPVKLKLLWGRVRSFAETDDTSGIQREKTPYFYIGDNNPVGPKCWKVRCLLFVKPDYIVLFDRVFGDVPHRYNLHFTGDGIAFDGQRFSGSGRFDLDLIGYVRHPAAFDLEQGTFVPNFNPPDMPDERFKHAQDFIRLTNKGDGVYRTVLFAAEKGRDVDFAPCLSTGIRVTTPEYVDYVFAGDETIDEAAGDIAFRGRNAWIRRTNTGDIRACMIDGDHLQAFGMRLTGIGPWSYSSAEGAVIHRGAPRGVDITAIGSGS
jgi:hypothetical protein